MNTILKKFSLIVQRSGSIGTRLVYPKKRHLGDRSLPGGLTTKLHARINRLVSASNCWLALRLRLKRWYPTKPTIHGL